MRNFSYLWCILVGCSLSRMYLNFFVIYLCSAGFFWMSEPNQQIKFQQMKLYEKNINKKEFVSGFSQLN